MAIHLVIVLPIFFNLAKISDVMITNPLERSYSLQVSETALKRELDNLGYNYEFKLAGDFVSTCKCILTDKENGTFLASGNGKGELISSRVGSLFEAAEHLFSHYDFISSDKITYLCSLDFCRDSIMCDALPLAILNDSKNEKIPFLEYKAVNGLKSCFYPLALSCPSYIDSLLVNDDLRKRDSFNYQRLEQYSSNSGTAIGMNGEEAIIHGLLESIERSSLSKFLTKTFLLNEEKPLRVINPITMPHNIIDVFSRIEKELGSKVFIFEMPNKFGIPAYCSWMEQHEFEIGIAGYGCSLSLEHAILRSLYEVAQYFLLSKHIFGIDWLKALDKKIPSQLVGLPLHQDCAKFNLGLKCRKFGSELIDYEDLAKLQFSKNPQTYLTQLTDIIYSNGEVPYASELKNFGNGINITHTFITGEDRFFNVMSGKSTFPTSLENY
jgi:ribosomal protein S12 methylthiotransferase accessory factor